MVTKPQMKLISDVLKDYTLTNTIKEYLYVSIYIRLYYIYIPNDIEFFEADPNIDISRT